MYIYRLYVRRYGTYRLTQDASDCPGRISSTLKDTYALEIEAPGNGYRVHGYGQTHSVTALRVIKVLKNVLPFASSKSVNVIPTT